jgi:hypothetical protein
MLFWLPEISRSLPTAYFVLFIIVLIEVFHFSILHPLCSYNIKKLDLKRDYLLRYNDCITARDNVVSRVIRLRTGDRGTILQLSAAARGFHLFQLVQTTCEAYQSSYSTGKQVCFLGSKAVGA